MRVARRVDQREFGVCVGARFVGDVTCWHGFEREPRGGHRRALGGRFDTRCRHGVGDGASGLRFASASGEMLSVWHSWSDRRAPCLTRKCKKTKGKTPKYRLPVRLIDLLPAANEASKHFAFETTARLTWGELLSLNDAREACGQRVSATYGGTKA